MALVPLRQSWHCQGLSSSGCPVGQCPHSRMFFESHSNGQWNSNTNKVSLSATMEASPLTSKLNNFLEASQVVRGWARITAEQLAALSTCQAAVGFGQRAFTFMFRHRIVPRAHHRPLFLYPAEKSTIKGMSMKKLLGRKRSPVRPPSRPPTTSPRVH